MIHYLKLVRFKNLLIIAVTQYIVRLCVIKPFFKYFTDSGLQISELNFALLVLTTVLIAAAGYVINDYFDMRIDWVNKPQDVIIGRQIKRRTAIMLHFVLNFIAIILSIYLSIHVGNIRLVGLFIFSIALLWFYSIYFKRTFLLGNIIVSFQTSLVPLLVWYFEISKFNNSVDTSVFNFLDLKKGLYTIAVFAFFLNLIREMVKDIEDIKGDRQSGCKTMPIVIGIINTERIVLSLVFFFVIGLSFVLKTIYKEELYLLFVYILLFVETPLIYFIISVIKARKILDYSKASGLIKLVMFTGISALVVFYVSIFHLIPFLK